MYILISANRLCGYSPFEPENDVSVFNKVSSGKFEFPPDVKLSRAGKFQGLHIFWF